MELGLEIVRVGYFFLTTFIFIYLGMYIISLTKFYQIFNVPGLIGVDLIKVEINALSYHLPVR